MKIVVKTPPWDNTRSRLHLRTFPTLDRQNSPSGFISLAENVCDKDTEESVEGCHAAT